MKNSEIIDILDRLLDGASRILRHDVRTAPPFEEVEPNKVNARMVNLWMKQFSEMGARNKAKNPVSRVKQISWMIKEKQIKASGAVGKRREDLFEVFWYRHESREFQHETLKTWLRNAKGLEGLGVIVAIVYPDLSERDEQNTLSELVMNLMRKKYHADKSNRLHVTGKGQVSHSIASPRVFKRFKPLNTAIGLVYDLEPFTPQEQEILFSAEPHAFQDKPLKNIESVNDLERSSKLDEQYLIWLEGAEFIWEVLKEEEKIRDEVSPKHEY